MRARYHIPDEPRPSGLVRYAVDPMWPLLSVMLAGHGIGGLWFIFNSHALGSPHKLRDWALGLGAILLSTILLFALLIAYENAHVLTEPQFQYALLSVPVVRLTAAYMLYISQSTSAELLQYFGGTLRNGLAALVALGAFSHLFLAKSQLPYGVLVMLR